MNGSTNKLQIFIIGNSMTGKRSLMKRLTGSTFSEHSDQNVFDDAVEKVVLFDKKKFTTHLNCSNCHELPFIESVAKVSDGIILVFSVDSDESFQSSLEDAFLIHSFRSHVPLFLCLTKSDLRDFYSTRSTEEIQKKFSQMIPHNFLFFETSSKLNTNVSNLFLSMVETIILNRRPHVGSFQLTDPPSTSKLMAKKCALV